VQSHITYNVIGNITIAAEFITTYPIIFNGTGPILRGSDVLIETILVDESILTKYPIGRVF
jgi:hypothetical protein